MSVSAVAPKVAPSEAAPIEAVRSEAVVSPDTALSTTVAAKLSVKSAEPEIKKEEAERLPSFLLERIEVAAKKQLNLDETGVTVEHLKRIAKEHPDFDTISLRGCANLGLDKSELLKDPETQSKKYDGFTPDHMYKDDPLKQVEECFTSLGKKCLETCFGTIEIEVGSREHNASRRMQKVWTRAVSVLLPAKEKEASSTKYRLRANEYPTLQDLNELTNSREDCYLRVLIGMKKSPSYSNLKATSPKKSATTPS